MKHRGGAENTGLGADAKVFISGKNMSKNVKDSLLNKIAEELPQYSYQVWISSYKKKNFILSRR